MQSDKPTSPAPRRHLLPAVVVFALALAATFIGTGDVLQRSHARQHERFVSAVALARESLQTRAANYGFLLRGLQAVTFLNAPPSPTLLQRYMQGLGWQRWFPEVIELGYVEAPPGQTAAATNLISLPLVKYQHLLGTNAVQQIGQPLNAGPETMAMLEGTRQYGGPTASTDFSPTNGHAPVVVAVLPAYRGGVAVDPLDRRARHTGWIYLVLNAEALLRDPERDPAKSIVEAKIIGMPLAQGAELRGQQAVEDAPPFVSVYREMGVGRDWLIRFEATPEFFREEDDSLPWVILATGSALSIFLAGITWMQGRRRREAELANAALQRHDGEIRALNEDLERRITERMGELREANERLQSEVAERSRLEENLRSALDEQKEVNELKSNFISMVSHEIRTPLALILSSSEILSRYLDRLAPEKRQRHLHNIDASVSRMSALMEDVLLFSRAEAGRMEFKPAPLDLEAFCLQLMDETRSATGQHTPIELELAPNDEMARGDTALLRHIFGNLLTNAVKYSPAGTPVKFQVTRAEGDAIFQIIDHGIGIPEADQPRLFTPFHRGANASNLNGTGLGLVIVRRCVERHGGRLDIQSREGVGTTVTVRLPMFSPAHTTFLKRFN